MADRGDDRGRGPGQALRRDPGPGRRRLLGAGGLDPRTARAERRRQDDRGADPDHAGPCPTRDARAVAGIDVVAHPAEVRRHIGVAAQDATLDGLLTGRQNLVLVGELSDMGRAASRTRATELLAQFELTDAADRVLKGYSGGMRRRLDLAASLMTRPPVLFLDEPTTGLDPTSRQRVWDAIRELLADGVTVLLHHASTSTRPTPWPTGSSSSTTAG